MLAVDYSVVEVTDFGLSKKVDQSQRNAKTHSHGDIHNPESMKSRL